MPSHVIYARKSTESEDRQILSIDSQVSELRTLAARRGIGAAEVLTESKSAKAPGRPVFGSLMRRVRRGEIRGIICWKMDRLARNHLDTGTILQALADGQLEEVMTSDRTYTRDGNDRFMGNFELGMATKYIDDLRANVRRGNRARFQRGWINYLPPTGYMNDLAAKTIVKDSERFDLVRRMWDLLLTGACRPEEIRRTANEDWGFQTLKRKRTGGKPLGRSMLYRIFGDPFYMGIIRLRSGETYPGGHPPMITKEEFDRAQEILGRPGRPRPQRHEFPFTGIIRCGGCGGSVTAEEHVKPSGRRYVYYHCSRQKTGVQCREPAVSGTALDEQFAQTLSKITIPPRTLQWIIEQVNRTVRPEEGSRQAARESLERALSATRREMENLVSLRLRDLVADDLFAAKKQEVDVRRMDLEAKLAAPARSHQDVARLTADTFKFAARVAETFRTGSRVRKRMIVEAVCSNPTLQERTLRTLLKNPFRLIAEAGSCSNWCTTADDVRTWIQDTRDYFTIPDLQEQSEDSPLPDVYEIMTS
jgi:DNA invertase Pin-like site-specific DNA recombinase